ncbi:MAG: carbon-nitrogen hydrolase [Campylobacterales bacterium]|nr:carbon-nitrogen hydrolase [Campylobacterales bacterium]
MAQLKISNDKTEVENKLINKVKELAKEGAELIVLQELHNTPYFCQTEDVNKFDLAETIPGRSTQIYGDLAKDLEVVIVLSLFEKRAKGLYHNTAVVIEKDGTIAGKYRKMHIPDDPGFYEKFYFTEGDLGFNPIKTSVGTLGVLICWDQWYPEAARIMALKGADLLIYPTAIGWDLNDTKEELIRQLDSWITIQKSHSVANGIPVVSVNRVGFEKADNSEEGISFWGNSFITGSQGELLQHFGESEEKGVVEVDLEKTEHTRRIWPFFRDRRFEDYSEILNRYLD